MLETSTSTAIPFFNYSALFNPQKEELLGVIESVLNKGAYILQKELQSFEKNLAAFIGAKHVIGVANGTDALMLALRAAGIKEGDEVIMPSHTYVATAASVHYLGAKPVLVECGPDHLIDPDAVRRAITKNTRFIMPVQLNGRTCEMDVLMEIAARHQLLIIEDAAQACGSKFKGKTAGTFGTAGTYSFYPAKVLGCFGDGGCVITNQDDIAERVLRLRDHGRNEEGIVEGWGMNSRLDNLQAAILDFKLRSFPESIERRRVIAARYQKALQGLEEIKLPPSPDSDPNHFDIYQNYEIEAEHRDELKKFLREQGIHTLIQWGGTPVHQISGLGFNLNLPMTDRLFKRCLLLPMNTTLTDEQVDFMCEKIQDFYPPTQKTPAIKPGMKAIKASSASVRFRQRASALDGPRSKPVRQKTDGSVLRRKGRRRVSRNHKRKPVGLHQKNRSYES